MNYKMIRFVISWVLKVEGMLMLLPALVGACLLYTSDAADEL